MAVDTTPPPAGARGSSKGLSGWVKKNKLAAGGIAAGAGFLFLSKKGDSGGGAIVSDGNATSPLSDLPNYGGTDPSGDTGTGGEGGGENGTGTGIPTEDTTTPDDGDTPDPADAAPTPITVVVQSPARPEDVAPAPSAPTPSFTETATTQQGVTLAGHFFAGATAHTMTGSGSNEFGSYMIHKISFPGRTEYWWHYTSGSASGKWTGPHASASAAPSRTPTVTVIPGSGVANPGGGGGGGGGGGAPAKEQPHMGANIFYNADRNLRYIIQKHSNGKNYKHYESKLNKGDWGSSAGPGVIPQ